MSALPAKQHTREALQCPANSLCDFKGAGYQSLAYILPKFHEISALPSHLALSRIDEGNGLAAVFTANRASWHKSCRNDFSLRELSRKQRRMCSKRSIELEDTSAAGDVQPSASQQPKRLFTRSAFDSDNPLRAKIPVCFFCDLPAGKKGLHEVTMFDVDTRVKECALALSDHRLLAKLAVGDMIALEAKYHVDCLNKLYNQRRSLERQQYRQLKAGVSVSIHSIAFAELASYIDEVRSVNDIMPYFKLADLKTLYTERLRQLDPAFNQSVNSTHLKEKLLAHFPDMHAETTGVNVTLGFQENVGAAVSRACSADLDEDALHLAHAAEIVRREMFTNTWKFNRSLHREGQEQSVPVTLLTLVNMILQGPAIDMQSLKTNTQAALTISQLIVFKRTSVNHVTGCSSPP